jgi:proline dehydrogenase
MLFRTLVLKLAAFKPFERLVTKSFLFRGLVKRFVAGEDLETAMQIGEQYVKDGYFVSMDLLGENVATKEEAEKETCAYIEMAERIAVSPQRDQMNISIKLTALGMDISDEIAAENYRRILEVCKPHNIFVRADMEASPYTQRTIDIVEKLFATYKNCGTVLQSYLHRTPSDVQKMIGLGARVRIVKGAYLEPETVAYQSKAKVDEMYLEAAKALLLEGNYPAIATHDINMIEPLKKFIKDNNIPKERYEWQMIYGVRRDLQEQLLKEGYNIRIYIPFGAAWYPYFSRRLAERPANMLFILKSLFKK